MVNVEFIGKLPTGMSKKLVTTLVNLAYELTEEEEEAAVTVSVVGETEIRKLNRDYRGKDSVTDVLSFSYDAGGDDYDIGPDGELARQLGDIIICAERVKQQARETGKLYREEFALMVVHGTLHLLGYDHADEETERIMFGLQHEVLIRAGIL